MILNHLIDLKDDGSFRLNLKYFNYPVGLTMINKNFIDLFGIKTRKPEKEKLTQFHMDIAASIQVVIEKIILRITNFLAKEYNVKNIVLAVGAQIVFLTANFRKKFKNIWIQPASGDAEELSVAFGILAFRIKTVRC